MTVGTIAPLILMIVASYITIDSLDWILAKFVMPKTIAWIYIVALGIFATFSQLYMTKAYSLASGGIVGTISYTNIIFSIALGMLLGDLFPSFMVIIGIILIIISGILVTLKK